MAPQPLRVPPHLGIAHFASFPVEWPRRLVLGWSPQSVCTACGQGRRRVPVAFGLDTSRPQTRRALELVREHGLTEAHLAALRAAGLSDTPRAIDTQGRTAVHEHPGRELVVEARAALGGYAREFLLSRATEFADACDCADPSAASVPGVVLDPFGGTGTTALAAAVHGRRAISLDASRDYCRLATWRVHDPRQQARARGTHQAPEAVPHAA
ncbi:site-specific DNA-methyltransferase [Amycolatopsis sp. K13G38]|uniref:Methyltransferase n=1 Tax=Amycolatopsis acididurans TaxID=2724524 RepID=A0ABX1J949_9PSEU|nr:site-specific DNA-methyltransferase [Amycolatopsis acididurans]